MKLALYRQSERNVGAAMQWEAKFTNQLLSATFVIERRMLAPRMLALRPLCAARSLARCFSPTAKPVIGQEVSVLQKQHQRTGERTSGTVANVLTRSAEHSRGFKVRLTSGIVGRCVEVLGASSGGHAAERRGVRRGPSDGPSGATGPPADWASDKRIAPDGMVCSRAVFRMGYPAASWQTAEPERRRDADGVLYTAAEFRAHYASGDATGDAAYTHWSNAGTTR